jgi:pimeloyl-ACP methyl ester carboxylesterase
MTDTGPTTTLRRGVVPLLAVLLVVLGSTAARAQAPGAPPAPDAPAANVATALKWAPCGLTPAATAVDVQCAVDRLPMDYDQPAGAQVNLAVAKVPARDQAHRIGSLLFNFGGPGGTSVAYLQASGAGFLAGLNERFDLVGFDPRGVGQSTPAVDCHVNQETQGLASQPFPTPLTIDPAAYRAKAQAYVDACRAANGAILAHLSTANVARDMDALRAAVGDEKLNYLGFSYGTFLGATYAALFPDRYRALVLDGDVDAAEYIHDPSGQGVEQTAAFERALNRFLEACAADQTACSGFGGADPHLAYDHLVAAADATPIPAPGYAADPRPIDGDDIRAATVQALYAKRFWGTLALLLARAAAGDGSGIRAVVDASVYGRRADGSYDPSTDRFFTITAAEQQFRRGDVGYYLARGADSWTSFPHFWWNTGYPDINYTLWPVHDADAFGGPWTVPAGSPTPLLISTTYDPATPNAWGRRLATELGNARLLTMNGDGHTAFGGNSACIDAATEAYLVDLTLPARGTVCQQQVPFTAPAPVPATTAAARSAILTAGPFGVPLGRRR